MSVTTLSTTHRTLISVFILALVVYGGWWLLTTKPTQGPDYSEAIGQKAIAFGEALRATSLTAEEEVRRESLEEAYGEFVAPELIERWVAYPDEAIGRYTSSPWPERIELGTVSRNHDGTYTALGSVIEVTSAGDGAVAIYPIALTFSKHDGSWLITHTEKGTYTALPERRTITGTFACLPHKDTGGLQTLECAQGLRAADGTHYALDFMALSQEAMPTFDVERTVRVEGTFVPVENLSTDHWSRYDIQGIIRVTSLAPF